METIDYEKKIALCERLGAKYFQKIVFLVEKLKYKVIKLFPDYMEKCDKLCDRAKEKALKKAKTPEEAQEIKEHYIQQKMLLRKELHTEQNRNYHMDPNKPTEIIKYLNSNKDVHMHGMIRNLIAIPALLVAVGLGFAPYATIPVLVMTLGSLFINFQCVNLQNYNIYQYEPRKERMQRGEERHDKRNIERYSEAGAVVSRCMEKTDDIPTLTEIIDSIETKEELEQFKKLVQQTLKNNQASAKNKQKTYTNQGGGN